MPEMIIQSPDEVVAYLKAQHNLIEDMFDQVLHATDPQAREEPFVHLRQLLAVHETAEEMVGTSSGPPRSGCHRLDRRCSARRGA